MDCLLPWSCPRPLRVVALPAAPPCPNKRFGARPGRGLAHWWTLAIPMLGIHRSEEDRSSGHRQRSPKRRLSAGQKGFFSCRSLSCFRCVFASVLSLHSRAALTAFAPVGSRTLHAKEIRNCDTRLQHSPPSTTSAWRVAEGQLHSQNRGAGQSTGGGVTSAQISLRTSLGGHERVKEARTALVRTLSTPPPFLPFVRRLRKHPRTIPSGHCPSVTDESSLSGTHRPHSQSMSAAAHS
jgi:hypothetical protein